jgi:hypothetical protein
VQKREIKRWIYSIINKNNIDKLVLSLTMPSVGTLYFGNIA